MSTKKYQVFVSSTFRDLVDERQDAIRNILDLKHIPAGMELFPATDVDQLSYIYKVIDECDYYLLIMGGRYGSLDAEGVSFTEREYDYAVISGKTIIAFVHDDLESIPVGKSETGEAILRSLNAFREKVKAGRLVRGWSTRQNLEPQVLKSLIHAFNDFPQMGWIRGDQAATEQLLAQSNRAMQENAELRQKLAEISPVLKPSIEGLADLEDKFNIRYRTSTYYPRSGTEYNDREIELYWRDIFLHLAAKLDKARTSPIISDAVAEAIKQSGKPQTFVGMDETDLVRIKVHLEALGLIQVRVSNTTQGGVAEFISLTPGGREKFLEGFVVRKV